MTTTRNNPARPRAACAAAAPPPGVFAWRPCHPARGRLARFALLVLPALLLLHSAPLSALPPATHRSARHAAFAAGQAATAAPRARISVRGAGWWDNFHQIRTINQILDAHRGPSVGASEIEDIAFVLISSFVDDGYLHPRLTLQVTSPEGVKGSYSCDETFDLSLPRDLRASAVRFEVARGRRYHLEHLVFSGLTALPEADARALFFPSTTWVGLSPPYSVNAFKHSVASLLEELRRRGHARAAIDASAIRIDDASGLVSAEIKVAQGPVWKVDRLVVNDSQTAIDTAELQKLAGRPWSQWWQQNLTEQARQLYFRHGYPDVVLRVEHSAGPSAFAGHPVSVSVTLHAAPGPQVRIGRVSLAGNRHTRPATILRRFRPREGDVFNPVRIENSRYRAAQLGVFDEVSLAVAPPDAVVRDITLAVREAPRHQASLLLGWGSYEELRGGVELRALNLIGVADQTRIQLVQSMKSTSGNLNLALPELLGHSVGTAVRLYGLHREEVSFDREEYGASVTFRRFLGRPRYDTSIGYSYEYLLNKHSTVENYTGQDDRSFAASIKFSIGLDRRDNPLLPYRGWHWLIQSETASQTLGGGANYQRSRFTASYHTSWKRVRWIHAGIDLGRIEPIAGDRPAGIPVNKLYYPGGQNSIRGYQEGEAAPYAPGGAGYLGANSYGLANLELEQALSDNWSAVIFYDLLASKAKLAPDPGYEWLHSLGLGIRYRTLLGPLRLEYGRNLNPRPRDPKGTLHLSIGFPF